MSLNKEAVKSKKNKFGKTLHVYTFVNLNDFIGLTHLGPDHLPYAVLDNWVSGSQFLGYFLVHLFLHRFKDSSHICRMTTTNKIIAVWKVKICQIWCTKGLHKYPKLKICLILFWRQYTFTQKTKQNQNMVTHDIKSSISLLSHIFGHKF